MRPLADSGFRPPPLHFVFLLLAALYGWANFVATFVAPGSIGPNFNGPGTDWMVFEGAAKLVRAGQIGIIFDGRVLTHFINSHFGYWLSTPLPYRPWVYPPSFLVLLAPFGFMAFFSSYVIFQIVSAVALVLALSMPTERRFEGAVVGLCAILCPAGAINVIDGQLAFLIAALMIGGIRLAEKRPYIGGLILGLLSIKPQFALLAPFALAGAANWRALATLTLSAVGLAALSVAILGATPWLVWIHQTTAALSGAAPSWVVAGRMWGNSVYTCAVLLGAPQMLASVLQLAAILGSAAATAAIYRRSDLAPGTRLAVLLVATFLAAPHSSAYDAVLITIAGLLWIAQTRQESWRWLLVLVLWLVPLVSPPLIVAAGRFVPLLLIGFLATIFREHLFAPKQVLGAASISSV